MKTGESYEGLKAWLRRYADLQTGADRLFDRADEMRLRIQDAKTTNLNGMPHGGQGYIDDRMGAVIAELEEIEDEAKSMLRDATAVRREITATIKQITGPQWADRREVLRMRYLDCKTWEDTAEKLFGDNPRYWDNPDTFLRRTFRLHRKALEELAQFVPLEHTQNWEDGL